MVEEITIFQQTSLLIKSVNGEARLWGGSTNDFDLFRATVAEMLGCTNCSDQIKSLVEGRRCITTPKVKGENLSDYEEEIEDLEEQATRPLELQSKAKKEIQGLIEKSPGVETLFYHSNYGGKWTPEECRKIKTLLSSLDWDTVDKYQNQVAMIIKGLDYCIQHQVGAKFI